MGVSGEADQCNKDIQGPCTDLLKSIKFSKPSGTIKWHGINKLKKIYCSNTIKDPPTSMTHIQCNMSQSVHCLHKVQSKQLWGIDTPWKCPASLCLPELLQRLLQELLSGILLGKCTCHTIHYATTVRSRLVSLEWWYSHLLPPKLKGSPVSLSLNVHCESLVLHYF